ncbi:MAG: class I SAM-dependent methyltransferase [Patescibacteria group bacterium]
MTITHEQQKQKWNREHENPFALKQMDATKASSSLLPFVDFLQNKEKQNLVGLEMGCGKGRNVIWFAQQSLVSKMYGFDFSGEAIIEANRRAVEANVLAKVCFETMDAIEIWRYPSDMFDFVIDCTASTDIEDIKGRQFAVSETHRVLIAGGYLLVYVMSTDDEYHKMMIEKSPAEEKNAFIHPETGKFEKVFSEEELDSAYKNFKLIEARRIEKTAEFFGKSYYCKHHWRIYQK